MRDLLRKHCLDCLGLFSRPANGVHILNGHMLSRYPADASSTLSFYRQLKQLRKWVRLIPIEEAVRLIREQCEPDDPLVAFTFDDGFEECDSALAPVLEDFGVNAAFFINPNFAEGDEKYIGEFTRQVVRTPGKQPMRWDQIKELHRRGHIIGAHTMDHYMVNTQDRQVLEYQIGKCQAVIEERLAVPCEYFAFPYGRLEHANREAIDLACRYYKYVFSQSDYKHYFSFEGRVINRRHFEPFWPVSHLYYFLSCHKTYPAFSSLQR